MNFNHFINNKNLRVFKAIFLILIKKPYTKLKNF